MSLPYTYSHGPNVYDGTIANIRVRWQAAGTAKLAPDAAEIGVPMETLKAVSEHFAFLLAYRLGSTQVLIRSGPHRFTVDSRTKSASADGDHITVELSGGAHGKRKCHIYLGGHGVGVAAYDNMKVTGESVMEKKGGNIDTKLSEGTVNGVLYGKAATMYGAAGVGGGAASTSSANYSEWQLDATHQRYRRFNYSTQQWEWN